MLLIAAFSEANREHTSPENALVEIHAGRDHVVAGTEFF
jgi:hypothetical protein